LINSLLLMSVIVESLNLKL